MKKMAVVFCLLPLLLSGQVAFESGQWNDLILKSRNEGKLIFVNAYTQWCEPCAEMEEYTFADLEVANYFNTNFINVQLDTEEYPGIELAEEYNIGVFPSFLFINGNGDIVHRGCGAMDAAEFLQLGEDVVSGKETLLVLQSKFAAGERSTDFMLQYFESLENACLDAEKSAANYLSTVELENLMNETPWEIFASYNWDIYSREFQYLIKNKAEFEEEIGKRMVNAKLYDTYLSQYQEVFASEELHDFGMRALLHSLKNISFIGSDTLTLMMNLHHSEFEEDWNDYATYAIELVGMTEIEDPEQLSELAWKFYLFVENKSQLEIAATWAKQAIDTRPEPSWIDTYASLQYKLGKRKKAVELEKRALEIARELNDDTSHYEYQLRKFEEK